MREERRKTALDQIDKLEKALRNIGLLDGEVHMSNGFTWKGLPIFIGPATVEEVQISIVDFLHALYHEIKGRE